jgi:hypothetical protein
VPAPTGGLIQSWVRFWFTPVDPIGLHVVRVLAGLLFLSYLLPFAGQVDSLFGLQGWFDVRAYTDMARIPDNGTDVLNYWSLLFLCGSSAQLLHAVYWGSVAVVALFTLGVCTRLTSILTWVAIASFTTTPAIIFDADCLLGILAFYLMVGYALLGLGQSKESSITAWLGFVPWLLGRSPGRPSVAANVALRLLQVHFAIVIVTSGLHKLQFGDWWAGVALWFPLYPPFTTTLAEAMEHQQMREYYLGMLSIAAYAMLIWQIGFPLFAWRPRWRLVLVGGTIIGWLGTAFIYRLPLFGPAFFIGSLTFITAEEWHRLFTRLGALPGLGWLDRWVPSATDEASEATATARTESDSLVAVGQR